MSRNKRVLGRSRFWWIWPDFHDEKDAYDIAKMGVVTCSLIAVMTGLTFVYRYYTDNDLTQLSGGILVFIVYCGLGYGILRMSRVACVIALLLFGLEKAYLLMQSQPVGIAPLLVWYLLQANRAVFWFRDSEESMDNEPSKVSTSLSCAHCGAKYRETDYSSVAPAWFCSQCKNPLPKNESTAA